MILHIAGIICEYNPLHLGHQKQSTAVRQQVGTDGGIVCAMSGNFVQRGHPAVFNKMARAAAAVECGADLVLELPLTVCLSSAEGFAAGGVQILSGLCHSLHFGAETADGEMLMDIARALLSPEFSPALRTQLDKGLSFPAARQAALAEMGLDSAVLATPNNILAVEYCKAIVSQNSALIPMPMCRPGGYHDTVIDPENPSATALRQALSQGQDWLSYVPRQGQDILAHATAHRLENGEKALLYRLRTMTEAEFAALPYGNEGLWRKLMHAAREYATLEKILSAVKSKRYTRTRLDRMVMCALLGIDEGVLGQPCPYTRVLALNDKGRAILKAAKQTGTFINAGEKFDHPYWLMESRATDLYALFADSPEAPGGEAEYRVYYRN